MTTPGRGTTPDEPDEYAVLADVPTFPLVPKSSRTLTGRVTTPGGPMNEGRCPATFQVGVLRRVRCQREAGHDGWHTQSVEHARLVLPTMGSADRLGVGSNPAPPSPILKSGALGDDGDT